MFLINSLKRKHLKEKFVAIGLNKTGTTTLEKTFLELGYQVGNQRRGELLLKDWGIRRFDKINDLICSADFFQDVPFSLPFTYQYIEQQFPNAKFILTVRNNSEDWYNSLTKFHSFLWGREGNIPTSHDLKNAMYIYKGRPYEANRLIWGTPENDPYNKVILNKFYENHNKNVMEYFKKIGEKLIIINVARQGDYQRLCDFCNKNPKRQHFVWMNKTPQ